MRETWVQSLSWEGSPGEGKGYPLQYFGLENSMDTVDGVAESDMTERLSLSRILLMSLAILSYNSRLSAN